MTPNIKVRAPIILAIAATYERASLRSTSAKNIVTVKISPEKNAALSASLILTGVILKKSAQKSLNSPIYKDQTLGSILIASK